MKTVYTIYESDNFHSIASSVLIGIYTDKEEAKKAVIKEIKRLAPTKKEANFQIQFFKDNLQTQKLCDIDLRIEEIELNKINS